MERPPRTQRSTLQIRDRVAGVAPLELPFATSRGRPAVANPGRRQVSEELWGAEKGEVEVLFELNASGQPDGIRRCTPEAEAEAAAAEAAALRAEAEAVEAGLRALEAAGGPGVEAGVGRASEPEGEAAAPGAVGLRVSAIVAVEASQPIFDLVPWLELGARRGWAVEPEGEARWGVRLGRALGSGVRVERLRVSPREAALPGAVRQRVLEALEGARLQGAVAFVWGGGRLPAGTGLWEAFVACHQRDPLAGHVAVSVDASGERLLIWSSPSVVESAPLRRRPGFAQLVGAAGFEEAPILPPPVPQEIQETAERLFRERVAYRQLCFDWAGRLASESLPGLSVDDHRAMLEDAFQRTISLDSMTALMEEGLRVGAPALTGASERAWVVKGLGPWLRRALGSLLRQQSVDGVAVALPDDPAVIHWLEQANGGDLEGALARGSLSLGLPGCDRFSVLFERMLEARVRRWAADRVGRIGGVVFNPTVRRPGSGQNAGEFDVAIVTRRGGLVVLDAKTFEEESSTRRAQTRLVEQVGGALAQRYIVVPAFQPEVGYPDANTPLDSWGLAPWYPRKLAVLLARSEDPRLSPEERPLALRFDATEALEEALDRICDV